MLKCHIVKDLLPSYIEDFTSQESKEEIEAHVEACESCKEALKQLKAPIQKDFSNNYIKEIDYMKKVRKRTRIIIMLVGVVILIACAFFIQVFLVKTPVRSKDISVMTHSLYEPRILDVEGDTMDIAEISFRLINDKNTAISLKMERDIIRTDNGELKQVGYILEPFEVMPIPFLRNERVTGWAMIDLQNEQTVTVRLKDKMMVFLMTDQGLIEFGYYEDGIQ